MLLLLCYQLAFRVTFAAWKVNRHLKEELASAGSLNYQPGYLTRKNANLDMIINRYKADSVTWRNNTINIVAIAAEKVDVRLSAVPAQDVLFSTDKYSIQKLVFEGGFFQMVKLLGQLQDMQQIGYVRSVTLKAAENRSGKDASARLFMEIYLEVLK